MRCTISVVAAVLISCGGSPATHETSASPILTGDTCALHQDATTCRADAQGCSWYPNTRACQVGEPCPAGWCSSPQTGGGDGGGVSASAGCACPGGGGDVCVEEIGGPALQQPAAITCEAVPQSCTLPDRCACVSSVSLGTCAASLQVTNLCVCDNGIR